MFVVSRADTLLLCMTVNFCSRDLKSTGTVRLQLTIILKTSQTLPEDGGHVVAALKVRLLKESGMYDGGREDKE